MSDGPNKVMQSSHVVMERKLLLALSDESKAAMIVDKIDLDILIESLRHVEEWSTSERHERARYLYASLNQLRRETFGE